MCASAVTGKELAWQRIAFFVISSVVFSGCSTMGGQEQNFSCTKPDPNYANLEFSVTAKQISEQMSVGIGDRWMFRKEFHAQQGGEHYVSPQSLIGKRLVVQCAQVEQVGSLDRYWHYYFVVKNVGAGELMFATSIPDEAMAEGERRRADIEQKIIWDKVRSEIVESANNINSGLSDYIGRKAWVYEGYRMTSLDGKGKYIPTLTEVTINGAVPSKSYDELKLLGRYCLMITTADGVRYCANRNFSSDEGVAVSSFKRSVMIEDPYKKYDLSSIQWRMVKAGVPWIGMSGDLAVLTRGRPMDINKTVTSGSVFEQWVYEEPGEYLYFRNGYLVSWQE